MSSLRSVVLIFLFALLHIQSVCCDYIGGVVNHVVCINGSSDPLVIKLVNLQHFRTAAAEASKHGVQVLLFPEFALAPGPPQSRTILKQYAEVIPDPDGTLIACNNRSYSHSPALFMSSCMALENEMVVVVNMWEVEPCSDSSCPIDGFRLYVSDVVFETNGALVARYRKTHPWYSGVIQPNPSSALVTYTSNFNVTFGLFICFDIAFQHPAVDLVNAGVKHFLYAAAIGELGAQTAARAFSYFHNVTLLLANLGADDSMMLREGQEIEHTIVQLDNAGGDSIYIAKIATD